MLYLTCVRKVFKQENARKQTDLYIIVTGRFMRGLPL